MKQSKDTFVAEVTTHYAVIHLKASSIRETSDAQKIMSELDELLVGFKADLVVVNFRRVNMVCSSFLGKLIALDRSLKERGIALRVCSLNPDVERAFKLLKLHKLLKICPTQEKALK